MVRAEGANVQGNLSWSFAKFYCLISLFASGTVCGGKSGQSMKNEFTIFFAIPFDSLTRDTYEAVRSELTEYYKKNGYSLTTIVGNERVGPSKRYWEVISFKAQNEDLHRQFIKDIKRSHVVVADLTNNNPNVHLELGIALAMNKNILRVTGRHVGEIGFDIRNMDAAEYKNEEGLVSIIKEYLDVFFKIKRLGYDVEMKELYQRMLPIKLPGTKGEVKRGITWITTSPMAVFRDGGIQLKAKFLDGINELPWLGIIFRMSEIDRSGYLLRFYKNGDIELVLHPSLGIIERKQCSPDDMTKAFELVVDIQNDEIEVKLNKKSFAFDSRLDLQDVGGVYLATFESQAEFECTETINRDTI